MQSPDPSSTAGGTRRYGLDWLRVLVSAAALPFYSLHQSVLIVVGYGVEQWTFPTRRSG